jgi:hypothetical protein
MRTVAMSPSEYAAAPTWHDIMRVVGQALRLRTCRSVVDFCCTCSRQLLVQSGHGDRTQRCPLSGGKRKSIGRCKPGLSKNGPPHSSTDQIILSYNRKETASFFDLKDFWLSLASDNHSTASSFQSTWPSRRSTASASISRHLPFSLSTFPQAWVLVEAAFDFEPTKHLLQDI